MRRCRDDDRLGVFFNHHQADFFEELTILKIDDFSSTGVQKEGDLIIQMPPGGHLKSNVSKSYHLNICKSLESPVKSWEVDCEVIEENRSNHPFGKSLTSVLPTKVHEGCYVPDVDSQMRRGDGVPFISKLSNLVKPHHLRGYFLSILSVTVDRQRKLISVVQPTKFRKGSQHSIQMKIFD